MSPASLCQGDSLAAVMEQSSVVTQGPGVLHPPREVLSSRAPCPGVELATASAVLLQVMQTSATTKLDPGREGTAELPLAASATTLTLDLHPDDVTQKHGITRDCGYLKTPLCIKGLGMVPKEQMKNFLLVLSSNLESHLQCHNDPNSSAGSRGG